ncbi:MAG: GNAT family N-acetyltransferase [Bdellovibrionales bacterium]
MVPQDFELRLARDEDVPAIRRLVNAAYKELADMGLNYTATYQDEDTTRERMSRGRTFVVERDGEIIGTVLLTTRNLFTHRRTAYVSQLAIKPELKKLGLGRVLMDHCEELARAEGFEGVQLDTAQPAVHLVNWYHRRGYTVVGETHWEGKTYDSFVFEKPL